MANCDECCETLQCEVDAIKENVTNLFGRTDDLNTELTRVVDESPYEIIDTEAQLDAGLLKGKKLVIRGEGNGGEIPITTFKNILIPGTEILGYGYLGSDPLPIQGTLKGNFPNPPLFGAGNAPVMLAVSTTDVKIQGIKFLGYDDLGLTIYESYIGVSINATTSVDRLTVRDCHFKNMYRALNKSGYVGCVDSHKITFENNLVENLTNFGVSIQGNVYDISVLNNTFIIHPDGAPKTYVWGQGIWMSAGLYGVNIRGNRVRNGIRNGIEVTTTALAYDNVEAVRRVNISDNHVYNVGTIGISSTYVQEGVIANNIVDGFTGIGIESANGKANDEVITNCSNVIVGNFVKNGYNPSVDPLSAYVTGISSDQSIDDLIAGNHINNIASAFVGVDGWSYARGVLIARGKRSNVKNNNFRNVDGVGVFVQPGHIVSGLMMVNIEGNDFYIDDQMINATYAVHVQASRSIVRNNTSWAPAGGAVQRFSFLFNNGTTINTGDNGDTVGVDGDFTDSNLQLTY